ncbi:MAG TPA: response regulator [Solirubrobacteraceae bacterium]|jgi:DNA-binding NarL/FixJ family response regulator
MGADATRVAIVEDHGPLRIFLRDFLTHTGWNVVGTAGGAGAAYDIIAGGCDVAVVDLHLAGEGGGQALIERLEGSDCRVLVFTASSDPSELGAVSGAVDGIVLKEGGFGELEAGLRAVVAGERFVSPSLPADVRQRLG